MTGSYIQMIVAFAALGAMFAAFYYMAKKKQKVAGMLNLLAYLPVGGQKSGVAALKVWGEILILGVTQNDIKVLKALKESELLQPIKADAMVEKLERLRKIKEGIDGKHA